VEAALDKYAKPGDSVFDPFCGSGTTLVASIARGQSAVGSDFDMLAGMLSEVKCHPKPRKEYDTWRTTFIERVRQDFAEISSSWPQKQAPSPGGEWSLGTLRLILPSFPELFYWFPPQLIAALSAIAHQARAERNPHLEKVALVSLSASIVSKWPNTLSYAMDIDHTRPHRKLQRFTLDRILSMYTAKLDRTISCLGELRRIYSEGGTNSNSTVKARVIFPHDARQAVPGLEPESQGIVVTSPPYFNAVDYPRAHRLAVCWMNGFAPANLVSRRGYVGLHGAPTFDSEKWLKDRPALRRLIPCVIRNDVALARKLCGFYDDLRAVLERVSCALRPGGHAVFVIANNVIKGNRIASHRILGYLAREVGFSEISNTSRQIESFRRRFPVGPFGFDGPMTHEFLVVLRKPRRTRTSSEVSHG
jgi:hypothetical protein